MVHRRRLCEAGRELTSHTHIAWVTLRILTAIMVVGFD